MNKCTYEDYLDVISDKPFFDTREVLEEFKYRTKTLSHFGDIWRQVNRQLVNQIKESEGQD